MRLFFKRIFLFSIVGLLILLIGLILPATPKASESLFLAKPTKDSLLTNVRAPRILFIAGSSMSFGLDSKVFKDSLHLNPINLGIHGGVGLFYMLDDSEKYIKQGDIVMVSPEYHQFYGDFADGGEELVRILFDNGNGKDYLKLRRKQLIKTYSHLPKYALSKYLPDEYYDLKPQNPFYSKNSFNEFGDAVAHWGSKSDKKVEPFKIIDGEVFRYDLVEALADFEKHVISKGAVLYLTFPPFQESSFENCKAQIHFLEKQLKKKHFRILGTPERFIMADSLIFDTPYHLNEKGASVRTELLRQDIAGAVKG